MKNLRILTLLALGFAGTLLAQEAQPSRKNPLQYLQKAQETLRECKSLRADLSETVRIFGPVTAEYQATAKGTYLQGRNFQSQIVLEVVSGRQKGSLLEVCDGSVKWTRLDVGGSTLVKRVDIKQILEFALAEKLFKREDIVARLRLGGFSGILSSIETYVDFDKTIPGEIDGTKTVILNGKWTKEFEQSIKQIPAGILSGDVIPDSLEIHLEEETALPRKIVYLKKISSIRLGNSKIKTGSSEQPIMVLELNNIRLNEPLDEDEFLFVPPEGQNVEQIDGTSFEVEQLKQAVQARAPQQAPKQP